MPINIELKVSDITISDKASAAVALGRLDPEQVFARFVTMHDDAVRPSHAALDGCLFALDDPDMPVPPLDYGCRCHLEYVAAKGSEADQFLEGTEETPRPDARQAAYADYLEDAIGPDLIEGAGKVLAKVPKAERLGKLWLYLRDELPPEKRKFARDFATMLVETL